MNQNKSIEHIGVVKSKMGNSVTISILSNSGCASCEINKTCNLSETKEKEIEVNQNGNDLSIGEQVIVYFNASKGFLAVFLGYVLPFLIVLLVLIILTELGTNEAEAGLLSILSLAPYYFIIFLLKGKLKETFRFSIKKFRESI